MPPHFTPSFRDTLSQLLQWRRDVRHFLPHPLPPGLLHELLQLACLAPSVGFSQPWRWVTVDDPTRRAAILDNFRRANAAALTKQSGDRATLYAELKLSGLVEAPVHLALFVDPTTPTGSGLGRLTMPEMLHYSAVCSLHTLWLLARTHGIGLGWVSILDPAEVRHTLDLPEQWELIAYLCLGYPQQEADSPELERAGWEAKQSLEAVRLAR